MARSKRTSPVLETAKKRRNALAAIDPNNPNFDLGNGLTKAAYDGSIDEAETKLDAYNAHLEHADRLLGEMKALEKPLATLNTRMLGGAKSKWGPDGIEYEMAGGTRTSAYKRKPRNATSGANAKPSA